MPSTIKTAPGVKYIRVATEPGVERVEAAGALWSGVSEVPAASLSAAQLKTLENTPGLKVTEAEPRPAEDAAS